MTFWKINDRFRRATTHPPDVSDQELQDTTYVDDTMMEIGMMVLKNFRSGIELKTIG